MARASYAQTCVCVMVGAAMVLAMGVAPAAGATIVRFSTQLGSFDVELYDADCPLTVANFLHYVENDGYADSFFHRLAYNQSDPNLPPDVPFVLQGGGLTFVPDPNDLTAMGTYGEVFKYSPVNNEFLHSNVRGTITMAKLGGDPNSATSEFFFNLGDNSANLDYQNGGFTVFGEVVGAGMDVVDLLTVSYDQVYQATVLHPWLGTLPLLNYDNTAWPTADNLEIFQVTVVPEPASLCLLGVGACLPLLRRRRR